MVNKSRLLSALDAYKGRDFKVEKHKALQKNAKKWKLAKATESHSVVEADFVLTDNVSQLNGNGDVEEGLATNSSAAVKINGSTELQTGDSNGPSQDVLTSQDGENDSSEVEGHSDLDVIPDDIPLSDMEDFSEDEDNDIVPYQRLTINNNSALLKAYKSIAVTTSSVPFSDHQTVISATPTSIPNVNDDLNRELALHRQCLEAVTEARILLKKEDIKFSRPTDYFAEMVKTDEHMEKIKAKIRDAATDKKAAAEARRQRDLKKFGKQVQVAKLQERGKARRETMDKINVLKRKRKDIELVNAQEEDLFDVALENASKPDRAGRGGRRPVQGKRQKRDAKFGFGGKKRFSKSGDAMSSGDLKGFSPNKSDFKKGASRLGKSRRAKMLRS